MRPIMLRNKEFHRTAEACQAGISKNAFFRWLRSGKVESVSTADKHGWRLFTRMIPNRCVAGHSK